MGQQHSFILTMQLEDQISNQDLCFPIFSASRKRKYQNPSLVNSNVLVTHILQRQISEAVEAKEETYKSLELVQSQVITNSQTDYFDRYAVKLQRIRILLTNMNDARCSRLKWNSKDCSRGMRISSENSSRVERLPICQSTDAVRTHRGWSRGLHAWTVHWPVSHRGSNATIGVSTKDMPLQVNSYTNLIGSDTHSWGVDLVNLTLLHNNTPTARLPPPSSPLDHVTMVLDSDAGVLWVVQEDGECVRAFEGLAGRKLFPCVASVCGGCEIAIRHIGCLPSGVCALSTLCKDSIVKSVGRKRISKFQQLPLPPSIIKQLISH